MVFQLLFFIRIFQFKRFTDKHILCMEYENVIGVYQNLNIVGIPADKNYVNFIVGLAIIVFATLIGTILFSIRYVSEIKVVLQYIREKICNIFSRLLCVENIYVNEFYKLMIVQKNGSYCCFYLLVL